MRFFMRLASTFAISWPPNSSLLELEPSRPVRTYAVERHKNFPPDVSRRLQRYVYRLIDPRNGETFYVGKGEGNRVFAHIRAETDLDGDELDNKMERIRAIRLAGFKVGHVIHRHGMDDKTALEVEAAVMDAYPANKETLRSHHLQLSAGHHRK